MLNIGVHESWIQDIEYALQQMDTEFINELNNNANWLPGLEFYLNAFTVPKEKVNYVLLGESPYPRVQSANGYAFWDEDVHELWSENGLSKKVNRATSLRNFIKMLLHADGVLNAPYKATDIALLDKSDFYATLDQLFERMLQEGFLLLNASLSWSKDKKVVIHAKAWKPFIQHVLNQLISLNPSIKFLLFGKIAEKFKDFPQKNILVAEHPYVLTFIDNPEVLSFFKPLHLLRKI